MLSLERREIWTLVGLALVYAALEGFGIGLLYPILQYVEEGAGALEAVTSEPWSTILQIITSLGLPPTLLTLLVFAFIPIALRQAVYFLYTRYGAIVQNRTQTRLREQGFSSIVHGDLAFAVEQGEGNLFSLIVTQVSRGGAAIFQFVRLISIAILIGLYLVILLFVEPLLTAVAIPVLGLISLMVRRTLTKSRRFGKTMKNRVNTVYRELGDLLSSIRLIKMRGLEDQETERVRRIAQDLEEVQIDIAVNRATLEIIVDPALMLGVFAIVFIGVDSLNMTLAGLGIFLFILLRLNAKAKEFNVGRQNLSANMDSLLFVHQTIAAARESRRITGGSVEMTGLGSGIELVDVSFTYGDDRGGKMVLSEVNLDVPRGSLTAIVGRSGAGKSTLADLIPRLRDATAGQVRIGGVPIQDYELTSLRRSVGFMTQEAILFSGSIRYNLTYGLTEPPSQADVDRALESAYCTSFVAELPDGLETTIGDRGVRLSGGQRQRLALARELLQDPEVLILDEPTSALDSESEQYIQNALEGLRGETTLIVIAHRMSTVQRADQIVVLDDGRVVERGTHQELLERDGPYRQLFDLQLRG